jgi:phosphotransferase system IIB component
MPRGVKNGVNVSEAIREQLKMNRKAKPAEIKQALAAKGIKASDSLISAVKYRKGAKKGTNKPGRKKGSKASVDSAPTGGTISIDALVAASKLVQSLGGAENAIKAINVLKRLGG